MAKREPLKHLNVPESLGIGEGGATLPKLYDYFKQIDDYIEQLLESGGQQGPPGEPGENGVSVVGATSDGINIIFELSDGNTIEVPWPDQSEGGE